MTARWLFLLTLGAFAGSLNATGEGCLENARTDLETLYCKVVSEGQGAGLPTWTDFRRNDPKVQALLLRRPAGRLGLVVPEVTASSAKPPQPQPANDPDDAKQVDTRQFRGKLARCRLEGPRINCPQGRYDLISNLPNRKLANGVLAAENHLGLSSFTGDRSDEDAVRRYLSDAYDRYIPKMVEIGLGANTMSFTAFHNAFHTMEDGGVDFARRMERTFTLLKQDKKNLAVKARYHDELPQDLSLCAVINADIVVCDNVGTNWVYVSPSR